MPLQYKITLSYEEATYLHDAMEYMNDRHTWATGDARTGALEIDKFAHYHCASRAYAIMELVKKAMSVKP